MKANELRIGNYVKSFKGIEVVVDVLCDSVNTEKIEGVHYGDISPIPLSYDWLITLGFKQENGLFYRSPYNQKPIYSRGKYFGFNSLGAGSVNCNEFQYVHQLQNLYFALTGEELTIKTK